MAFSRTVRNHEPADHGIILDEVYMLFFVIIFWHEGDRDGVFFQQHFILSKHFVNLQALNIPTLEVQQKGMARIADWE